MKKYLWMSSAAVLVGAIRINKQRLSLSDCLVQDKEQQLTKD